MKNVILIFVLSCLMATPLFAAAQSQSQSVTIHVPSSLSLAASQGQIQLAFPENRQGAETNTTTITYSVKSNGMSQPDGAPAVLAQLDALFPGMDLRASVGPYVSRGGNTELASLNSGFVNIRNAQTALLAKQHSAGDGHLLYGDFPVTYKAVALESLMAGDYARQLTLTLTDV